MKLWYKKFKRPWASMKLFFAKRHRIPTTPLRTEGPGHDYFDRDAGWTPVFRGSRRLGLYVHYKSEHIR